LLHCNAHDCSVRDILAEVGMTEADLFPTRDGRLPRPHANGQARPAGESKSRVYPTPEAAIEAIARELGKPTSCWTYHKADGSEVARVYRFDPLGERKQFRPVHRSPEGWVLGDPPGPWPLYRLPELAGAGRVSVCEGEKAAGLGLVATTSAHGAKSARKTDWAPLAGREVIILPDHDPEGEGYARDVVAELSKLDPPPTVRIVRLSELWRTDRPIIEGADIEEWLTDGIPEEWSPEDCRTELERVSDGAPLVDFHPRPTAEPRDGPEPPIGPAWPDPPKAAAFDGLAGEIVRAIEPHTEADPVAILAQLLIGFGNLIGRHAYFAVEADRHYANEFAALVGETAQGAKGTSWGHARRLLEGKERTRPGRLIA
jgi:putative DNA primase/helicase